MNGFQVLLGFIVFAFASTLLGWRLNGMYQSHWPFIKEGGSLIAGKWALGGFLVSAIGAIVYTVGQVAACTAFVEEPLLFELRPEFGLCAVDRPILLGWYGVLTQWQTGIGAGLGLLGLTWAAYFERGSKSHDLLEKKVDAILDFHDIEAPKGD